MWFISYVFKFQNHKLLLTNLKLVELIFFFYNNQKIVKEKT